MTIKEMAEATGRDERTIGRWIEATSGIMPKVIDGTSPIMGGDYDETSAGIAKVDTGKPGIVPDDFKKRLDDAKKSGKKAAEFTLPEVLRIFEHGIGLEVAQQYAQGAALTKAMTSPVVREDDMISEWVEPTVQSMIEALRENGRIMQDMSKLLTKQPERWYSNVTYDEGMAIIKTEGDITNNWLHDNILPRLELPLDTWTWSLRQCHIGDLAYNPPRIWPVAEIYRVWRFWCDWRLGRLPMIHGPR